MRKASFILFAAVAAFIMSSFINCPIPQDEQEEALTWYTSLDEVQKLSKESGKPIFGFFTGSDWCGWCHKLQREVFAKDAFVKWAKENVILLELDFPRKKQLPADLAKQNRELQAAFKVTGYPTIWVFFADKEEETGKINLTALGKLGYPRGAEPGKEEVKFIQDADAVMANKDKIKN